MHPVRRERCRAIFKFGHHRNHLPLKPSGNPFHDPQHATKRARRGTAAKQAQAAHTLVSAVIESGEASTDEAHRRYELPPSVEQRVWGAVSTTRSETFGNPRFLAEARSALAGIRELGGLNAPQKVEIRSTHDVYLDIDRLPRDERERLAEIHRLEQSGLIRFVDDGGEGVGESSI